MTRAPSMMSISPVPTAVGMAPAIKPTWPAFMGLENTKRCCVPSAMSTWAIFQENLLTTKADRIRKQRPVKSLA